MSRYGYDNYDPRPLRRSSTSGYPTPPYSSRNNSDYDSDRSGYRSDRARREGYSEPRRYSSSRPADDYDKYRPSSSSSRRYSLSSDPDRRYPPRDYDRPRETSSSSSRRSSRDLSSDQDRSSRYPSDRSRESSEERQSRSRSNFPLPTRLFKGHSDSRPPLSNQRYGDSRSRSREDPAPGLSRRNTSADGRDSSRDRERDSRSQSRKDPVPGISRRHTSADGRDPSRDRERDSRRSSRHYDQPHSILRNPLPSPEVSPKSKQRVRFEDDYKPRKLQRSMSMREPSVSPERQPLSDLRDRRSSRHRDTGSRSSGSSEQARRDRIEAQNAEIRARTASTQPLQRKSTWAGYGDTGYSTRRASPRGSPREEQSRRFSRGY